MAEVKIVKLVDVDGNAIAPQTHADAVKGLHVPRRIRDLEDKETVIYLGDLYGTLSYEYPAIYDVNLKYLLDSGDIELYSSDDQQLIAFNL